MTETQPPAPPDDEPGSEWTSEDGCLPSLGGCLGSLFVIDASIWVGILLVSAIGFFVTKCVGGN